MGACTFRINTVGSVRRGVAVGIEAEWLWKFYSGFRTAFSSKGLVGYSIGDGKSIAVGGSGDASVPVDVSLAVQQRSG